MKARALLTVANWFVLGYFVVLFAERAQSVVRTIKDHQISMFGSGFNKYVYSLTLLSLIGFLIVLFTFNLPWLKSLVSVKQEVFDCIDLRMLALAVGVILLSGMVHTEYTVPTIQFGAYGLLIVGMVLYTINYAPVSESKFMLWLSLVYLIAFSMAIPVVYHSNIEQAVLFHVVEAVVSVLLVAVFTYMTYLVFAGGAVNLFLLWPILIAAIGDAVVLALRWKEEVNTFVLIFVIVASVLWVIGAICSKLVR